MQAVFLSVYCIHL